MPPKRSAIPMSRADNVRHIWAEFEAWHTEQLALLDERIAKALREIDQNRKPIVGKKKNKGKDKEKADTEHEKKKEDARKELEKTFDGDKVREEWQSRLQRAGLDDEDWGVMTTNEQRKIEKILGLDLDFTEGDVTIEAGPPQPPAPPTATQRTSPPPLHTSPHSNSSRMDAISDNYAFVDPASFHVPETVEASPFDNWLEVRQRIKSDDEVSLDASTTSSWGGGGEVPAYLAWSSEISRSSAQSSQTSLSGSPERAAKLLPEHSQSNLLSSAVNRLALFGDSQWNGDALNAKRPADAAHMPGGFPSMTTFDNFSGDTQTSRAVPSAKPSKSRTGHRYIGPELVDDEEKAEAEEFMECKLKIRVEIIREFHAEAAEAGIRLARALANEIQNGTSSKERTARMTQEHEEGMLVLRESKERKRKQLVEKERQERLTKFQQRKRKQTQMPTQTQTQTHAAPQLTAPPQNTSPNDYPFDQSLLTEKFLRELSHGPDADSAPQPNVSETPTIRSQLNRLRVPVISDWLSGAGSAAAASAGASTDSGTDTPTPTMKSSGWKIKETSTPAPALNDAPSFKRLPSGLAQSVSADSTSTTPDDVHPLPSTNPPKTAVSSALKKSETKSARTNNKTKKEKTQSTVTQTEEASSSKTNVEQMVQKSTKVDQLRPSPKHSPPISANTTLSSPPPPVPLSTRPDIPATPALPMPMYNVSPLMDSIYRMPTLVETQNHAQPQPQPQAHHHFSSTVADNHQRWVPPAATAVDKRPHTSRTTTEHPSQIKKANTSQSTLLQPPEPFRRERRMSDPVSPSPRSFDYPNGKIAAKANDAPASILKKATVANTAKKTAGSKPSAKVKKVTIEDVKDDEEEDRVEALPSDSRHIMEPKPVAAPNMYSQIFQFGEDDKGVKEKEKEKERAPPSQASRPPPQTVAVQVRRQESDSSTSSSSSSASLAAPKSNQMWIPPQASMAEAAKPKSTQALSTTSASTRGPTHFDDPSEKHVRWGGATAFKQKREESGDSFLAGLDQLMKAVGQEEKEKEPSHKPRPRAVESGWSAAGKSAAGNLFWDPNAKNTHRKPLATS